MTKRSQFVVMTALAAEAISMAPRLVVISGFGSRGVGLGVARQVLEQDSTAEVVVMARTLERAASVSAELGAPARTPGGRAPRRAVARGAAAEAGGAAPPRDAAVVEGT